MTRQNSQITGILLVGGKSRRMGHDKALLTVDGQQMARRMIDCLQNCCAQVMLVGDRPERFSSFNLPVIADRYPGSALGGLFTGLQHAATEWAFVAACDIPFPNPALMQLICDAADGADVVVPVSAKGWEPLFACYRKSCLPAMQIALEAQQYRITSVLKSLQLREIGAELMHGIDPAGRSLLNLNTPDEYRIWSGAAP